MVGKASIGDSGSSTTAPTVSNRRRTTAMSSADAAAPAAMPVTALPTTAGVFGIHRKTTARGPRLPVNTAIGTPAATLTTIAPSRTYGALPRTPSGHQPRLPPYHTNAAEAHQA